MARRLSLNTSRLWSPAFTHTLQEFSVPFPATAFLIILSSFPCCSSAFLSSQNTRVESLGFFVFFFHRHRPGDFVPFSLGPLLDLGRSFCPEAN